MAARRARRQVRLALAPPPHDDADDWVVYDFVPKPDEPPCSLPCLVTWFNRFQQTYRVTIVICLFAVWLPLIRDSPSPSLSKIDQMLNSSNTTQPDSLVPLDRSSDLSSQPLVNWITIVCCVGAVLFSIRRHVFKLNDPILEQIDCRMLIPLVFSSIFNQLATGLISRPLELITDLRFQSILIFQIVGFFLCLFCAFIFGVLYVAYPGVDLVDVEKESTVSV